MRSKPTTVAIIGFGRQGREHFKSLQALSRTGQIHIIAICETQAVEVEDIPIFTDYKKLFATVSPDLVVIAVPNNLHKEITIAALQHGADVLKEKPLALNYKDGQEILKLAKVQHKLVITAQQRYYIPLFIKTKQILKTVGKPLRFSYQFTLNDTNPSWYWDIKQSGGGSWLNIGWHGLTTIQWLLGEITTVNLSWNSGGKREWEYETDHSSFAQVTLANGCTGTLFFSCIYPKEERLKIECEHGTVYVDRNILRVKRSTTVTEYDVATTTDPYLDQYRNVLECMQKRSYNADFDLQVLKSIEAGVASVQQRSIDAR